ncbi:MAG: acylphosphatase, partial [Nocardioidaceae bacterium]
MTSGRGSQSDLAPSPTRISLRHRRRIVVTGVVQGVGFRPFVYTCASRYGLSGWVRNDANGVVLEVEGDLDALASFVAALHDEIPPLAVVETVDVAEVPTEGGTGFAIGSTDSAGSVRTLASPDIAMCADCEAELADPHNRRYRHPFITCTNCGPRFTIITGLPYDRPSTTMARFTMCDPCSAEFADPADRRFHAQTIACPDCGPRLELVDVDGAGCSGEDALAGARAGLAAGAIVAVKGIGGYHLACDATNPDAV